MKRTLENKYYRSILIGVFVILMACTSRVKNSNQMKKNINFYPKGTYGYDSAFLAKEKVETIELKDEGSDSRVLIAPGFQGRVMTSSSGGVEGASYGWVNYKLIGSGERNSQFNPFGGEERLWLGPEGGSFSIYFAKGKEQVFANWRVPKEIDTETFDVIEKKLKKVSFRKEFSLTNASGTILNIGINRTVKILSKDEIEQALQLPLDRSLNYVAFESENKLTNKGTNDWTEKSGVLSIWLLCMFNPSEQGVVFIPFKRGSDAELGKIVTDDYFGKVPSDRLKVTEDILFFKTDGKYRSKIGISPQRALSYCGSYDAKNQVLTLLWYSNPTIPSKYVNSKWGNQVDPLSGDVLNSYNDGPVEDGSVMGPFYEIESSSPAAAISAGESMTHTQRIFHITGDEDKLSLITEQLFHVSIDEIKHVF
ncbi:MAG: hypothetical protein Q8N05_12310 [Bacteroidota bacterium]|nr:hypothetical protein [Bacteroidota bacterium]